MKTLKIYQRTVLERTQYKKYRFKEVTQVTIIYDGHIYRNHSEDINNSRLKVKFSPVLETRKTGELKNYIATLGRSDADKWQKEVLSKIGEQA